MTEEGSVISFHEGETIHRAAEKYPTLIAVILEMIQNAIDATAKNIWVMIDMSRRDILVRDDGTGVSRHQLERNFQKIHKSSKTHEDLGQFGIGFISPLGKCVCFTFTSAPRSIGAGYIEWEFNSEKIRSQEKLGLIPFRVRDDLVLAGRSRRKEKNRRGEIEVNWVTEVHIERFTADRQISKVNMDDLEQQILDRYSTAMRKKKVTIHVEIVDQNGRREEHEITAKRFGGERLEELVITEPECGRTTFRLYPAPHDNRTRKRKGRVVMGEAENDFRFPWSGFVRQMGELLSSEVVTALSSGIFEGEIISEKAKLRVSRTTFESNDAAAAVAVCIETWWKRVGKKHATAVAEARQDERYQELGVRSMKNIHALRQDRQLAPILEEAISLLTRGTIGPGHVDPEDNRVVGEQKIPSTSTYGGVLGEHKPSRKPKKRKRSDPETEIVSHKPLTAAGPKGQRRVIVKDNSLGLQICHIVMETEGKVYDFDGVEGILYLNVQHPFWRKCERSDRALMQFQETVIVHALTLFATARAFPEQSEALKGIMEELLPAQVGLILNSSSFGGSSSKKQ